ncbi:MAG: hypothetical protein ACRBDL_02945 [Alphaproteobacteria bacterium]
MAFLITGIFSIDRELIEFTENEDGTGAVIYPSHAYEILVEIDGKKFETDGVVWTVDGQQPSCFIGEEFEDVLEKNYASNYTEECREKLSQFISDAYSKKEIVLPFIVWE